MKKFDIKNLVSLTIFTILSGIYFYICTAHIYDIPYANDDLNIFLLDFNEEFLQAKSFKDKLKYFIATTYHPHVQIFAKILSIISYYGFGEISWPFINFIGILIPPILILALIKNKILSNPIIIAIACSLVFIPMTSTSFWKILITSQSNQIFAALTLLSIVKKSYISAIFAFFLTVFSSIKGILLLPIIFLLFIISSLYKELKITKGLYAFVIVSFLITYILLNVSLSFFDNPLDTFNIRLKDSTGNSGIILNKIKFFISNSCQVITKSFKIANPISTFIFSSCFITSLFALITFKVKQIKSFPFDFGFFMYQVFNLIILSQFTFNGVSENPYSNIIPRYEIHSMFFILSSVILILKLYPLKRNFRTIPLLLFAILYISRFKWETNKLQYFKTYHNNRIGKNILAYKTSPIISAINTDLYKPDTEWYITNSELREGCIAENNKSFDSNIIIENIEVVKGTMVVWLIAEKLPKTVLSLYLLEDDNCYSMMPFKTRIAVPKTMDKFESAKYRSGYYYLVHRIKDTTIKSGTYKLYACYDEKKCKYLESDLVID